MPGTNLRLGLSGFGEGIAQGMRFGTANKERVLWHREGLRRQEEERDYDQKMHLRNALLQEIISDKFEKNRSLKSNAINTLSDAIKLTDENLYNNPNYLSIRGKLDEMRKAVYRGDIDPLDVTITPEYVTAMSAARSEAKDEETRRFNLMHSGGGGKDTGKEEIPQFHVYYDPEDRRYKVDTERNLGNVAMNIDRLGTEGRASEEKKEKRINILNALTEEKQTYKDAILNAKQGNLDITDKDMRTHLTESMKTFGKDIPILNTATFDDRLAQADADTQKKYQELDEEEKKLVKELVEAGDDPGAVIADILEQKGRIKPHAAD
jgi:hypothetical protein